MQNTPTQENYVEVIWRLIEEKGYARVAEIADYMGVNKPAVSKMVQKLSVNGLVEYERYRGLTLTSEGQVLGKQLCVRHQVLECFLELLGIQDTDQIHQTVEGIEHHMNGDALNRIAQLVRYIEMNRQWWEEFTSCEGLDELVSFSQDSA